MFLGRAVCVLATGCAQAFIKTSYYAFPCNRRTFWSVNDLTGVLALM